MKKLILPFLLLTLSAFGQLMDPTKLPVAEPKVPYATTASSSTRDIERWTWANWQYQDRQKLIAINASLKTQIATLQGQLANAPSSAVDLSPLMTKLTNIESLLKSAVVNVKMTVVAGIMSGTLTWDYIGSTAVGWKIERSADGVAFTTLASLTDKTARLYVDKPIPPGTYTWRVRTIEPDGSNSTPASTPATSAP